MSEAQRRNRCDGAAQTGGPAGRPVVQAARRLQPDVPVDRAGAGHRRGVRERRQPRAGRCLCLPGAGHQGPDLPAEHHTAAEAGPDPVARRRHGRTGDDRRHLRRRRAGRRGARRRIRCRAGAAVRRSTDRRRAGHRGPGTSAAVGQGTGCHRGSGRRRRADRGHRDVPAGTSPLGADRRRRTGRCAVDDRRAGGGTSGSAGGDGPVRGRRGGPADRGAAVIRSSRRPACR